MHAHFEGTRSCSMSHKPSENLSISVHAIETLHPTTTLQPGETLAKVSKNARGILTQSPHSESSADSNFITASLSTGNNQASGCHLIKCSELLYTKNVEPHLASFKIFTTEQIKHICNTLLHDA